MEVTRVTGVRPVHWLPAHSTVQQIIATKNVALQTLFVV
ncbi:hypothetical protein AIOL_002860 [Candidatus Rhodobacter oscarellae]|uniref:Uncharacterized protein n=1 Tax=Candidatus Rhodobacter oscarellae TaxID=1675527 RepID=A0A0J9E563_9RHOB|nr:hypothetical protein AIOL_002860 [Candidatus Rhodobacter lobularis]